MNTTKFSLLVIILIVLMAGGYFWFSLRSQFGNSQAINSYEDCAAAGYPIMESYPEQCRTPDGRTFTRDLDRAVPPVTSTGSPSTAGQPITITGEVICLPHKDTSGPMTLECAFGIKDAATGNYYALRDSAMKFITDLPTGETATVTGALTEDSTSKYNIVGVIEVQRVER